jgi:cytochrome c553
MMPSICQIEVRPRGAAFVQARFQVDLRERLELESLADHAKPTFICTRRIRLPLIALANMKKLFALLVLAGMAHAAAAADIVGNAKAASAKVEMCIGCHGIPGYKATFPEVFPVPMIGGQSAKYIENALKAYQKGDRKHPSMKGIAVSLSDQDIADVAAYYSQQTTVQK